MEDLGRELVGLHKFAELSTALARLGVIAGHSTLRDSSAEPRQLVEDAVAELRLLVQHGSKFISTDWFEPMLRRKRGLQVRFLVHKEIKDGEVDTYRSLYESFKARNAREDDRLQIRTYDAEPDFRMIFVDRNYLVLSHYATGDEEGETDADTLWDVPHLVIKCRGLLSSEHNFSLYRPFERLWLQRWEEGENYFDPPAFPPSASGNTRFTE